MSQGSLNVPVTGPDPPSNFAGEINTSLDAIVTQNSGAGAPTNFPTTGSAATAFQQWADTSPGGGIVDMREFDGSSWLRRGAQDQTAHTWMPIIGGGSGTIAAAATTDLGSVRQSYMTVTGAVPGTPITSFGSSALLTTGESKLLRFTAAGIITHNAVSMIMPGAADLSFNVGDTLQALYLGAGNWLAFDYRSNASAGRRTGDMVQRWSAGTVAGAVRANGLTIGNAASGGTERANADTVNLFIFLYINDTTLAVSGGRTAPGTTRANAITDYNLNKTIALPDRSFSTPMGAPLYFASGIAATFTTPLDATALRIQLIAGGGGGGGSTGAGSPGNDTTFGTVSAKAGTGGAAAGVGTGGVGGAGGAGAATFRFAGSDGQTVTGNVGGMGGAGVFGGGTHNASNGGTNTGSGGGGRSEAAASAGGGGSGEYDVLDISSPAVSYTYTVGTGGPTGTGNPGGNGADGLIIVQVYGPPTYISL